MQVYYEYLPILVTLCNLTYFPYIVVECYTSEQYLHCAELAAYKLTCDLKTRH